MNGNAITGMSLYLQYELSEGKQHKDEVHGPKIARSGKWYTKRYGLGHLDTHGNPGYYKHDPGEVGESAHNVTEGGRGKRGRRGRGGEEGAKGRGRERKKGEGGEGGRESTHKWREAVGRRRGGGEKV